jgi:hypothetical protein
MPPAVQPGNSTAALASPSCRREHAALARTYFEWHAQRATLVQTLCLAVTASLPTTGVGNANDQTRASRQWTKAHGLIGADDCGSWGAPFALRSATAALSPMRTQPHVARLRDQIALALLAAPTGGGMLSPRAKRLLDSPELLSLLRKCANDGGRGGTGAAGLADLGGTAADGGGKGGSGGGAHAGLARTPLARMLSRQRRYLAAQPRQEAGTGGQGAAGSGPGAAPLSATTRLRLPGGGWMPFIGLGTSARCSCPHALAGRLGD